MLFFVQYYGLSIMKLPKYSAIINNLIVCFKEKINDTKYLPV